MSNKKSNPNSRPAQIVNEQNQIDDEFVEKENDFEIAPEVKNILKNFEKKVYKPAQNVQ